MQIEGKNCFCRGILCLPNLALTEIYILFSDFISALNSFSHNENYEKGKGRFCDRFPQANHAINLQNQLASEDNLIFC